MVLPDPLRMLYNPGNESSVLASRSGFGEGAFFKSKVLDPKLLIASIFSKTELIVLFLFGLASLFTVIVLTNWPRSFSTEVPIALIGSFNLPQMKTQVIG